MTFNLILDSGAFSAWTKKTNISVKDYTDFCIKHLDNVEYIVNLDVIPGEFGKFDMTDKEIDKAALTGWKNYLYMIKRLPPEKIIPVFHQGEKFKWLQRMIDHCNYLGLSPANDRSTEEKIDWLDQCMRYVCDDKGMPIVKFHAFGVTSVRILRWFPWYSADSASWVIFSRYGTILVPQHDPMNKRLYDKAPMTIQVTKRAASIKERGYKHYDNMPEEAQVIIRKYIFDMGFKIGNSKIKDDKEVIIREGVSNNHRMRDLLNLCFFLGVQKQMPEWPWKYTFKGW